MFHSDGHAAKLMHYQVTIKGEYIIADLTTGEFVVLMIARKLRTLSLLLLGSWGLYSHYSLQGNSNPIYNTTASHIRALTFS